MAHPNAMIPTARKPRPFLPDRRALLGFGVALPALLALGRPAAAGLSVFARDGIALGGSDPVAYFTVGAPRAGDPALGLIWRGAVWHFVSPESRAAFEMNPRSYAPRFGGWCAYAMSGGRLEPSVPEAWTIYNGALYLKSSLAARARWERDIAGHIARAEAVWPGILG